MGVELLGGVDQGYPGLSALDAEIGVVGCGRWVGEQVVDLAGDVAFQTSDDFSTGLAFFLASLDVCDRSLVVSHPGDGNVPEGAVGFTVPSPVEAVAYGSSRRRLDGACAAQRREGRFRLHAFGVVTGCDQQGGGGVHADSWGAEQRRVGPGAETVDLGVQLLNLGGECLVSKGQKAECLFGIRCGGTGCARTESSTGFDPSSGGQFPELMLDLVGSCYYQTVQLVDGLGSGLNRGTADQS